MYYDLATTMQFLVSGIAMGLVYSLIALGFTVLFNASGLLNFAQGSFVMLGGMLTYIFFSKGMALDAAAVLAVLSTAAVAAVIYLGVVRRLQSKAAPLNIQIIALIGIATVLENTALVVGGSNSVGYPSFVSGAPFKLFNVTLNRADLFVGVGALLAMLILNLFFLRTKAGIAMRAAAINKTAARLVGIRVELMVFYAFIISGLLGAVGGALVTPVQFTAFNIAIPLTIKGFAAAILGGFGNIYGAMLGGVILGIVESLGVAYLSTGYKDAIPFAVLLLILLSRPQGLLPSLVQEDEL